MAAAAAGTMATVWVLEAGGGASPLVLPQQCTAAQLGDAVRARFGHGHAHAHGHGGAVVLVHDGRVLRQSPRALFGSCGVRNGDVVQVVPSVAAVRPLCVRGRGSGKALQLSHLLDVMADLRVLKGQTPCQAAADWHDTVLSLCETLDLTADTLERARVEVRRAAAVIRALELARQCGTLPPTLQVGTATSFEVQTAPALLAMLAKALSAYAGQPQPTLQRQTDHLHSFVYVVVPISKPSEVDEERTRKQFMAYGEGVPAAAPELCLSADELSSWADHVHGCLIFNSHAMVHAVSVAFCLKALAEGAALMFIRPPEKTAAIMQSLSDRGVDTQKLLATSHVRFVNSEQFYLRDLTPETLLPSACTLVNDMLQVPGVNAIRYLGEPHYPLPCDKTSYIKNLVEYEKLLDHALVKVTPLAGLCMYDATLFPKSVLQAVLHAHPTCVEYV
eukprot:TRINITY_DN2423_c0_g1_i1.p1 TRINITY_DN2423_c0_g1~~TRINITY_DN2423_c0_g1_i1.p1  ORF type:complete len:447 (-),score=117.55 TRINITY_DN2423_c0_g1_i1:57-1397(-)